MAVSWGNAECSDERPGKRLAAATVPGAAPETARDAAPPARCEREEPPREQGESA